LFDIADLVKTTADPSTIVDPAFAAWSAADPSVTPQNLNIPNLPSPYILGQHYFITNPISGTGLSPKWDFTSNALAGNSSAFVVGAKTGDLPAPTGPSDVDWLMLKAVQGDLASQIYRTDTRGGQPPASVRG
jgi:Protein of unknown function (DUF3455)